MKESIFKFKKFEIIQRAEVMKVGTDGVLLGASADPAKAERILDIGTGTGLIALMLAQKSNALIDCIDINPDAAELAKINVSKSEWADRIKVYNQSLQKFKPSCKYDFIVSNPPFFSNGVKPPDKNRAIARHSHELLMSDLISYSYNLLENSGKFCIIYPLEEAAEFEKIAYSTGFYLNSSLFIFPKPQQPCVRKINTFSKNKTDNIIEQKIIIENNERHNYTEDYKNLTKDYYIIF